jgi:hypothetical protein
LQTPLKAIVKKAFATLQISTQQNFVILDIPVTSGTAHDRSGTPFEATTKIAFLDFEDLHSTEPHRPRPNVLHEPHTPADAPCT